MKFSPTMIIILGLVAAVVVLRIMTPSAEQQVMDYYNQQMQMQSLQSQQMLEQLNQQNAAMQQQSMQMLQSMQNDMMGPNMNGYNGYAMPNPYQNGYQDPYQSQYQQSYYNY